MAGILAIVFTLTACSGVTRDPVDASNATGGSGGSTEGGSAPDGNCRRDTALPDIVPARNTPDPDDLTCLLPAPEPPLCIPQCAAPRSPIFECGGSGRGPATSFGIAGIYSLVLADAQGFYWRDEQGYLRMARADAPKSSEILAYVGDQSFTIDDDFVYFGSPADSGEIMLTKMKRDRTERTFLTAMGPWPWLAVDREFVYFSAADKRLASVPKAGGTPVDVGIGETISAFLEVDDTDFYWLEKNASDSLLKRKAKASRTIETVNTGISGVEWNRQEGDGILMLAADVIWEMPKAGGCPRVIVATPNDDGQEVHWFLADGKGIYWTSSTDIGDSPNIHLWHAPRWGGSVVSMTRGTVGGLSVNLALAPKQLFLVVDSALRSIARN